MTVATRQGYKIRNAQIIILRESKKTYREIADLFGISQCRVRDIYERHLFTLKHKKPIRKWDAAKAKQIMMKGK